MTETKKTKAPEELTPITKKPIQQVQSDQWRDMSVSELWDQRAILMQRLGYASQFGHPSMIQQISIGIEMLDALIDSKSNTTNETRLL